MFICSQRSSSFVNKAKCKQHFSPRCQITPELNSFLFFQVYLNTEKTDAWLLFSDVLFLIQPTARPRPHPPPAPGAGPSVGVGGGVSGWYLASLPVVQVNDGVDVSAGVSGRRGCSHRSRSDGRLFQRRTASSLPGTIFQFTFLVATCGGFSPVLKSLPARFLQRGRPRLPVEVAGHAVEPAHVPMDLWDPLNKSTTINTIVRISFIYRHLSKYEG